MSEMADRSERRRRREQLLELAQRSLSLAGLAVGLAKSDELGGQDDLEFCEEDLRRIRESSTERPTTAAECSPQEPPGFSAPIEGYVFHW